MNFLKRILFNSFNFVDRTLEIAYISSKYFLVITAAITSGVILTLLLSPSEIRQQPAVFLEKGLTPYLTSDAINNNTGKKYDPIIKIVSNSTRSMCSAFVISNEYAMTAAHCVVANYGNFDKKQALIKDPLDVYDTKGELTKTTVKAVAAVVYTDIALLKGDFQEFSKLMVDYKGFLVGSTSGPFVVCGFPYGVKDLVCKPFLPAIEDNSFMIIGNGVLFRGMSGGPVIDMSKGVVIAINEAVTSNGPRVTPVLGFFTIIGLEIK